MIMINTAPRPAATRRLRQTALLRARLLSARLLFGAVLVPFLSPFSSSARPSVTVSGRAVSVLPMAVANSSGGKRTTDTTYVARLDMTDSVTVKVTFSRPFSRWRIRPGVVSARKEGQTLIFTLESPRYLSVETDGCLFGNLLLFADRPLPEPKMGRGDIYFGPGDHIIKGDSLKVKSAQTVYIDGGAVIHGWIAVDSCSDVRILGHGLIAPGRHEGIMVRNSRRVTIDGPLTTQIPVGGSDSVTVRNAKCVSSYQWGDGMNVFASRDITYRNVFCRTSDDCSTIYCTRKGYRGSSRNISVEGAVYRADVAHPIMIGLHGDIDRHETIENVCYRNIDILEQSEAQIDYQGCIAINDGDNITVGDITFDSIRVDDISQGMLFNIRVCCNRKYCHAPGAGIRDITLSNISYRGSGANMSVITGYDERRKVSGVRFKNLSIAGRVISDDMEGKLKWYKTADYANIFVGEHVDGVTFER